MEAEKGYKDLILSSQDIVKSRYIGIDLSPHPISFRSSETNMRKWILGGSVEEINCPDFDSESHELNPEVVLGLTSLLPDKPSSPTPLLDKIINIPWIPIAITRRLHEYRRKQLMRENPNLRFENPPSKAITIRH